MRGPLVLHPGECEYPRLLFVAALLLCAICAACGAVGSGPAPAPPLPVTVTVTPNSVQSFPGANVQFTAVVENASNSAVIWMVNQMQGGNQTWGTISSTGSSTSTYTAPNSVSSQTSVMVTAALQSDSTKSGSASVTILSPSSFTGSLVVSPSLSSVTTSQTLQFQVSTPGITISNNNVNWAADGGTITPDGRFTPPITPGPYTVEASLPNSVGFATVEVTDFPGMLTWRNDNSRSGVNSHEFLLAPTTVGSSAFRKLFSCPIDGYAYAQPLYVPNLQIPGNGVHNVVFVATEKDLVFAFDADANPCQLLWKQPGLFPVGSEPFFPPKPAPGAPNFVIVPTVGITGTPVIDVSASTLYVVATTQTVTGLNPNYSQILFGLDLATGQLKIGPTGVTTGSGENQRAALLLDSGTVYVALGSYGGLGDYHGWLFGYDASSLQPEGVFNVTPHGQFGGIWQSGGGPSADSTHNLFVATGDGPSNQGENYSDSFLRLGTNGGLSVADYFTPCDQGLDWGVSPNAVLQSVSSAPVLLPDSAGSVTQPHLLLGGSKNGSLYIVNRDSMGGIDVTCQTDSYPRVQIVWVGAGAILSTPLFWNGNVYVAPGDGKLMSFPMSGGVLAPPPAVSESTETLGPQGATPVISSNGINNAILWLIDSGGALATPNAPAILRAYDPNNLSNEIYNSATAPASRDTAGLAVKFTVPTVANGKVYVGTQTELDVYGLLQ
jgi:hypothetical protein